MDVYSEELHQLLLRNAAEARELRKQIRRIDKRLATLGFAGGELGPRGELNLDFARASMKASIYDQAVLEGGRDVLPPDRGDHRERARERRHSYRRAASAQPEARLGVRAGP